VVEDDFVVVVVVVKERNLEGAGVRFDRTGAECAYDEILSHEGGVGRRGQGVAMTHHRADVAPIHSHRYQLSMPADRIERIVREGDRRQPTASLHYYARDSVALLRPERVVHARRVEDRGIEDSLRPED